MNLIGLVEQNNHVCVRYRLVPMINSFAASGDKMKLQLIPKSLWQRWQSWKSLDAADVIILQRKLLAPWHLGAIKRHSKCLIYDFDDAVYQRDSNRKKPPYSLARELRFRRTLRAATLVFAGNNYLAEIASETVPAERIYRVPTCVDPKLHQLASHLKDKPGPVLVWSGSTSTLPSIAGKKDLFDRLASLFPSASFRVICDSFPQFARMPVEEVTWSEESENNGLSSADIGIAWMPDDSWSLGKCGLKVIKYMAHGLPVIANPVGVHRELVNHGVTGLLASTVEEWSEAIEYLARNPDVRTRMGNAGRRVIEQEYSTATLDTCWRNAIAGLHQ